MDRPREQKKVIALLTLGTVLCLAATVIFVVMTVASLGRASLDIPLVLFAVGALCFPAAIFLGWRNVGIRDSSQPVIREPKTYIISCRVESKRGEHVFEPDSYNEDELEWLVQAMFRNGEQFEFTTTREVFEGIGEGVVGVLIFQGRRVLGFEPDRGATESKKYIPKSFG